MLSISRNIHLCLFAEEEGVEVLESRPTTRFKTTQSPYSKDDGLVISHQSYNIEYFQSNPKA